MSTSIDETTFTIMGVVLTIKQNEMSNKIQHTEYIAGLFKEANLDGEDMQRIIEEVGMRAQMQRQLLLSASIGEADALMEEFKTLQVKSKVKEPKSPLIDRLKTYANAASSWGEFNLTESGHIQWGTSNYDTDYLKDEDFYIRDVKRFDIEEVEVYMDRIGFPVDGRTDLDILDLGYWDNQDVYHEPDLQWREEVFHGGLNTESTLDEKETLINRFLRQQNKWIEDNRTNETK